MKDRSQYQRVSGYPRNTRHFVGEVHCRLPHVLHCSVCMVSQDGKDLSDPEATIYVKARLYIVEYSKNGMKQNGKRMRREVFVDFENEKFVIVRPSDEMKMLGNDIANNRSQTEGLPVCEVVYFANEEEIMFGIRNLLTGGEDSDIPMVRVPIMKSNYVYSADPKHRSDLMGGL